MRTKASVAQAHPGILKSCQAKILRKTDPKNVLGNEHSSDGTSPAEVTEIRLEEEAIQPLTKESLAQRDSLLSAGNREDGSFSHARQFAEADVIVLAAPFWDLSFPALVKLYLEMVTVTGVTFRYTEEGIPEGLCRAKKLYYVTTAGGPFLPEFGFGYVKALAENFYGIRETRCISAEGPDVIGNDVEAILREAEQEIERL